jgi:hypothetical protein
MLIINILKDKMKALLCCGENVQAPTCLVDTYFKEKKAKNVQIIFYFNKTPEKSCTSLKDVTDDVFKGPCLIHHEFMNMIWKKPHTTQLWTAVCEPPFTKWLIFVGNKRFTRRNFVLSTLIQNQR